MSKSDHGVPSPLSTERYQRWSSAQAAELLAAAAASGLSLSAFARERGLPLARLYAWRHRLGDRGPAVAHDARPSFVNITQAVATPGCPVLVLASGLRIEHPHLIPVAVLRELVDALSC